MRLIDADALLDKLQMFSCYCEEDECEFMYIDLRTVINAPTIDAVPVVRCRQCAQAKRFHNPTMGDLILCNEYRVFTDDDGFCHKGAKKDGGVEDSND